VASHNRVSQPSKRPGRSGREAVCCSLRCLVVATGRRCGLHFFGRFGQPWQHHRVPGVHLVIGLAPGLRLLLRQQRCFYLGRHLDKGGLTPRHKGIHKHQMPPIAGFDLPLPAAGFGAEYHLRKDRTKLPGSVPVRAVGVMAAWAVPLEFRARK